MERERNERIEQEREAAFQAELAQLAGRYAGKALIANVAGNVMDYGGSVVGHELIITGNYSQAALKFRAGGRAETVANIPAAASF